jgi:hypothetical protein
MIICPLSVIGFSSSHEQIADGLGSVLTFDAMLRAPSRPDAGSADLEYQLAPQVA